MLALVDESHLQPGPGVGAFILGCVVIPHAEVDQIRRVAAGLQHFSGSTPAQQAAMLRTVASLRPLAVSYVYRGTYQVGWEGARQASIRRMLLDLRDWGVTELIFEARRPRENTKDALTVYGAGHIGFGPKPLDCHWRGKSETLLRLPDIVAGGVRATRLAPPKHRAEVALKPTFVRSAP